MFAVLEERGANLHSGDYERIISASLVCIPIIAQSQTYAKEKLGLSQIWLMAHFKFAQDA